jgi:hypothetical protein
MNAIEAGNRVHVTGHGAGLVLTVTMNSCQVLLDDHDRALWFPPRELAPIRKADGRSRSGLSTR